MGVELIVLTRLCGVARPPRMRVRRLQSIQYSFIAEDLNSPMCDNIVNKVLTLLGFLHICLQPYFTHVINASLVCMSVVIARWAWCCPGVPCASGVVLDWSVAEAGVSWVRVCRAQHPAHFTASARV